MNGLAPHTEKIFEKVSNLECIKEYTLIGGTALALQSDKRLSEDLDFCKWSSNPGTDKPTVDWPNIEKEINEDVGRVTKREVLGFDQVNFEVEGVKLSFYANQNNKSPITSTKQILNNIKVPDLETIGAMKLEVMQRRSLFRDYYDLHTILEEGVSLNKMIDKAVSYSGNTISSKNICAFISNGENFRNDPEFNLLQPKKPISSNEIAAQIVKTLKKENPIELSKAIYHNHRSKVKDILGRSSDVVSNNHIKLMDEMKQNKVPLDSKIEAHVRQVYRENNKNSLKL
jgi:hypothetical protein